MKYIHFLVLVTSVLPLLPTLSRQDNCISTEIFQFPLYLQSENKSGNATHLIHIFCQPSLPEQVSKYCLSLSLSDRACDEVLEYLLSLVKSKRLGSGCCSSFPFSTATSFNAHDDNFSLESSGQFMNSCDLRSGFKNVLFDNQGSGLSLGWHISPDRVPPFLWSPPPWSFVNWRSSILERGYVVRSNSYEFPVAMMIRLDVNFSATYLDVGANCGTTSLPVAALPQRHWVHAFEPTGDMMRLLCHSKTSNGGLLDRLVLVQKAVSESASNQTLFVPVDREDNSAFGRTASTLNLGGGVVREERVQTVSLDEYLADRRIPQVALLKSDTQGHEYAVLKGAERSLRYRRILSVFAENDVGLLEASGVAPETLWRFMHSVGFQAFNPAHESYQVGRDAATSFRRQPSAEPLSGLLPFDGAPEATAHSQ
mmetsp:Transcript_3820/g.5725  ORF Transcript_3820/g.5725 Transcript_3820/m.5725 type:complete len:425 (-) Transcript_3820:2241-3515(-)